MTKVLHVVTDTNIGGAGRCLLALLGAYDRGSFEMECALPEGSALAPELDALNVTYHETRHIGERSFSVKGVAELSKLIKKQKPDIVHTHASLSGRLAARLRRRAVVYTRHSVFEPTPRQRSFPVKHISGFCNRLLCDAVIAVSPVVREYLLATGVPDSLITVVNNGVPPVREFSDDEKSALRKHYGVPEGAFTVSLIARLSREKGHIHALIAAKALAEDADILFIFAGGGQEEERLRARIAKEGLTNVKMTGFVAAVEEIESITDLQINASVGTETCSLSLLEGMSLGIPAVVSDYGGNPFVITDGLTGFIVPQNDGAALAAAIKRLKDDAGLYKTMSENARAEYIKRFRASDMAEGVEALYASVLEKRSRGKRAEAEGD
jgi:glycosyltransferase involved in cell wall biosynthesis